MKALPLILTEGRDNTGTLTIGPAQIRLTQVQRSASTGITTALASPADGRVWRELMAEWLAGEGE